MIHINKKNITLFLIIFVTLITGCSTKNQAPPNNDKINLTSNYSYEDDVTKGYVVETNTEIKNLNNLDLFVEKKVDSVKIVKITTEGEPIYYQLSYSNNKINYNIDYSKDSYSQQKSIKTSCSKISKNITESSVVYALSDCEIKDIELTLITTERLP